MSLSQDSSLGILCSQRRDGGHDAWHLRGVITAHNGVAPDATQGFEIVVEATLRRRRSGLVGPDAGDPPFAVSATATGRW